MAKTPWISRDRGVDYRRFVIQKAVIEKHFPCFKCKLSHRHLECEGWITPSEDCATYRVAISYPKFRSCEQKPANLGSSKPGQPHKHRG